MSDEKSSRTGLLKQLRKLGVETVTAEYDGCGDSGQVDDPHFDSEKVSGDLAMSVQELFYDVLEEYYGGWEINEGSYGLFTWDVRADKINLLHTMRLDETEEKDL
jgi:Family of unknown function (DUF6878)